MNQAKLQYLHQERQALYSPKGIFATLIKHYRWKEIAFKTISHMNSTIERELIGELKMESSSIEQFELMENWRLCWRNKHSTWKNQFRIKLLPHQMIPTDLDNWI